ELRFGGDGGELPPIEVDGDGGKTRLIGVADRVDGWIHNDKLYIRVIDYKTGKKSFRLSDILYGMGMQMLIYLFALKDEGEELYKKEIVPAGVLYAPARDAITPVSGSDISDEELEAEKLKKSIRSGLLLNDPEVIDAMENGTKHKYIPVKLSKEGLPSGDSLAGTEELGALARHIFMLISGMGNELRQGELSADPYFRSQLDNACVYCDYFGACHFRSAGDEDRPRYVSRVKTPEAWEKIMRNRK
ncbi:MAG: PD-(D/E)XK nuclease family protein, partial [Oscillospiraceae bacterium]|nr:PD-(D/E)XK nuclease family protein [Oscillospiraceae bacterium]